MDTFNKTSSFLNNEISALKEIEDVVFDYLDSKQFSNKFSTAIVATSGGADSLSLLTFLDKYKNYFGFSKIIALHVNHGIRGSEAVRDANFVSNFAEKIGVEFLLYEAANDFEIPENASEDWARDVRYSYFEDALQKYDNAAIFTAHTMSDQAETVLFRLCRGTGLNGASGIQFQRGSFIRPFLCLTRTQIEQLCDLYGLEYVTDSTNLENKYSRNKIRNIVAPVLNEINSDFEHKISEFSNICQKYFDFVHQVALNNLNLIASNHNTWLLDEFLEFDDIVQEDMLLEILRRAGNPSQKLLNAFKAVIFREDIIDSPDFIRGSFDINDDYMIWVTNDLIILKRKTKQGYFMKLTDALSSSVEYPLISEFGRAVGVDIIDSNEFKNLLKTTPNALKKYSFIDITNMPLNEFVIRNLATGDKFNRSGHYDKASKFVKDVPVVQRSDIPVIEYNGEIVWIYDVGPSYMFKYSESSKYLLLIRQDLQ